MGSILPIMRYFFLLALFAAGCTQATVSPQPTAKPAVTSKVTRSRMLVSAPAPAPVTYPVHFQWQLSNEQDLAGYRIYAGAVSKTYQLAKDVGKVSTAVVNFPASKATYIALAAYNTIGIETFSPQEIATAIPIPTPTPSPTATPVPTPKPIALLLSISTRGYVGAGDNVLIAGFNASGGIGRFLIRGLGMSIPIKGQLADPTLELHEPNGMVISNDNWRDTQTVEITATKLPPTNKFESAMVVTLSPGSYSVILRGKNNGVGIGLVEVYKLPDVPASK